MADIKQIEVGGTKYNIAGAAIILEDNGTTQTGVWKAKTNQITSLIDGQLFLYKIIKEANYERTSPGSHMAYTATLTITANGTSLGAKDVSGGKIYKRINSTYSAVNVIPNKINVGDFLILAYNNTNTCFEIVNSSLASLYNANSEYGGTYVQLNSPASNIGGSTKINIGYFYKPNNAYGCMSFRYNDYQNLSELYVPDLIRTDTVKTTKVYADGLILSGNGNRSSYSDRSYIYLGTDIYFRTGVYDESEFDCSAQIDFKKTGLFVNRSINISNPDEPAGIQPFKIGYNKLISNGNLLELMTYGNGGNIQLNENKTKIYLRNSDNYEACAGLELNDNGLYTNRAIYLTDANSDYYNPKLKLKYNATDDSLDIIFE